MAKREKRQREPLSVRLYPEQWEELRQWADQHLRPLNSEVQAAVEKHLAELRKNGTRER